MICLRGHLNSMNQIHVRRMQAESKKKSCQRQWLSSSSQLRNTPLWLQQLFRSTDDSILSPLSSWIFVWCQRLPHLTPPHPSFPPDLTPMTLYQTLESWLWQCSVLPRILRSLAWFPRFYLLCGPLQETLCRKLAAARIDETRQAGRVDSQLR